MRLTVIREFSACCCYSDFICIFCYCQYTDFFYNYIVSCFCVFCPFKFVSIVAASYFCLTACCCNFCIFTFYEAFNASCCLQWFTVIHFACCWCCYCQDCWRNCDCSVYFLDIQLGCYIFTLCISDDQRVTCCIYSFCCYICYTCI